MRSPEGIVDPKYREHDVFGQLSRYVEFYDTLSMSVFSFSILGTKAICNVDSYVYSSIQGTLESISHALANGRIGDAYALLRRYYDSAIINLYSNLYLQDHVSVTNFIVEQIQGWLNGKKQLPQYRVMSEYVRRSPRVAPITKMLFSDSTYAAIRDRCNDYMHYNFYSNMLSNDNQVYLKDRVSIVDAFSRDLDDLLIMHLGLIFYLNGHYMMASDYLDHLECGMTPPENSQHFVAPFIQEIFDTVVKERRMDIFSEIKNHTGMELE